MMPIVMYKKVGETPLECLDRLRLEQPQFSKNADKKSLPLSYAGRLDPMAEGVLLVLVGDECKNREVFLNLEKEYICEFIWGLSTDTYDILGKLVGRAEKSDGFLNNENINNLQKTLQKFVGKRMQDFPPFSSKPVQGKPLHEWARAGRLDEIEIPSKEIEIRNIDLLQTIEISAKDLEKEILERLSLVDGDFRQDEIVKLWRDRLTENFSEKFSVSKIKVNCSSGTYIRSLVNEIGKAEGGAVVFKLLRTKVGEYC